MTNKLYTVAGVSTLNGVTKARFANDVMRVKVLDKNGHTEILFVELPEAMTKVDAAKFIAGLPEFQGAESQVAIAEYLGKHDKAPKAVFKSKAPVETVKFEDVSQETLDAEDAPF